MPFFLREGAALCGRRDRSARPALVSGRQSVGEASLSFADFGRRTSGETGEPRENRRFSRQASMASAK